MDVLIAEAIPSWVMGLRIDQIAPEKQKFVIFLKSEAIEVLYRRFYKGDSGRVAQPEPEVAQPTMPSGSKSGAAAGSPRERLFAALGAAQDALRDLWEEEQAKDEHLARSQRALAGRVEVVEEWVKSLDGRVAGMGPGGAAESGWLPLLSGAHLAEMHMLLRSLEQATGRAQAQLEQELVETFRVAAINALPEEQWEDVLAWYLWRARQAG